MNTSPITQWQSFAGEATFSDPSTFSKDSAGFARRIHIRNVIEYAVGAILIVMFTGVAIMAFVKGEAFLGSSSVAIVAGVIAVVWNLRRRAGNLTRAPEEPCVVYLRRQYLHQRDALLAVPIWYIGPLIPGVLLFYAAVFAGVAEVIGISRALEGIAGPAAFTLAIFGIVALANWIAARNLTRKIEELDALA